ncbi:MAG: hypothetical protein QOI03_1789 [Solirubrobacteraceae bacterium]|nr:hypothetical protein [Solirubrobacteraceae bacterium]
MIGRALLASKHVRVAAAVAALAVTLAAAGLQDAAADSGGFGLRPAHFDPANPATRAYFIRTVAPGASFSDQVVASNSSGAALTLRVYAVDGLTGKTSGAVYGNRADRKFRAGTWVRPGVSRITLAPHGQGVVAFTVRVPARGLPGDHLAGIAFETTRRPSSGAHFAVVEVVRDVVGVLVEVPGPARPQIKLGGAKLAALPGLSRASVVIGIGNAGRKLCKPTLQVALAGPHAYRRTVAARLDTILPGDTIPFPVAWPTRLRVGRYSASVRAACPGTVASSRAAVQLGSALDGPTAPSAQVTHPSQGGTPVWVFVAIAFGGAAAGGTLSRRRHSRRPSETSV